MKELKIKLISFTKFHHLNAFTCSLLWQIEKVLIKQIKKTNLLAETYNQIEEIEEIEVIPNHTLLNSLISKFEKYLAFATFITTIEDKKDLMAKLVNLINEEVEKINDQNTSNYWNDIKNRIEKIIMEDKEKLTKYMNIYPVIQYKISDILEEINEYNPD